MFFEVPIQSSTTGIPCSLYSTSQVFKAEGMDRSLGWEENLTAELQTAWKQWFGELQKLQDLKIPRC